MDAKHQESIGFRHFLKLQNLEIVHGLNVSHHFSRHLHKSLIVGIIENGARECQYQGATCFIPSGSVFVINQGEVHACRPITDGTHSYRILCIDSQALHWITSEFAGSIRTKPFFRDLVIQDRQLYQKILRLCLALDDLISTLDKEDRLLSLLTYLIVNHAVDTPDWHPLGKERSAVKLAREYIEEHCLDDISINHLASISLLSPYHLMRVFRKEVGIPPHAYQSHMRIKNARKLLSEGMSITDVASATGYVDQTHFTRVFKQLLGITPGMFSKANRDGIRS